MMALITHEVSGPRLHAPVPVSGSYLPVTENKTAINRMLNYLRALLHRLVPSHRVVQRGNTMQTTIIKEGMTQESYILDNNPSDKEEGSKDKNSNFLSNEEDTLFTSSLLLNDLSSFDVFIQRDPKTPVG
jgi:hypothetical protein